MKNDSFKMTVIALVVVSCVLTLSALANAESLVQSAGGCSLATLKGPYAFTANGFNTDNPDEFFPTRAVGITTYDGAGNFTGVTYFNAPPGFIKVTNKGTYKVRHDCTGSSTSEIVEFPDLPPGHTAFVIVGGGEEIFSVSKDTGRVSSATGKRQ